MKRFCTLLLAGVLALEAGDSGRDYFNVWIDKDPVAKPDCPFRI